MLYETYSIGGVLYHADRANHKYIQKVKTKSGKWRYIYKDVSNRYAANYQAYLNNKHMQEYNKAVDSLKEYPEARRIIDQEIDKYKFLGLDVPDIIKFYDRGIENEKKLYTNQANSAEKLVASTAKKYYDHMDRARKTESNWRRQEMEDRRSKADTAKKQKNMTIWDEMKKMKKKRK